MSSTQFLTDATTRHAVFLERYSKGRSKEAIILLNRIKRDIIIRLAQEPTTFQRNRLEAVLKDVEAIMVEGFNGIALKVNQDVSELAIAEAKHSTAVFNKASSANFTLPDDDQLISAVATQAMAAQTGVAVTIEEALSQFSKKKQAEIANIIADGVTLGDTTPVISKKVSTTIDTLNRRQVDTLVRTVANHASSVSRQQVYNANSDLMEGYQWIATLDSRTTLICASRDKKVYQTPHGPMPPAHWGACIEGTLITTKRGKIPIQHVKVGDYALTHTGRWKRVNAIMAKEHKGVIRTLKNSFGGSVGLTNDHPVLTRVGYYSVDSIGVGDKCFNYSHELLRLKNWILGSSVKQTVLIDAHNIKTECVESLVSYSVTSNTAGVSSSIKLDNNIINKEINYVFTNYFLKLKFYATHIKKLYEHLFMESGVIKKSDRQ